MPLVRISLPLETSAQQLSAVSDAIHNAMVETFNVPADDRFQVVTRHPVDELVCTPEYLGIKHTSRVAFVQITANEGRSTELKRALFAAIAAGIMKTGAATAADVIISLVEVKKENWSFGNGVAQYAI